MPEAPGKAGIILALNLRCDGGAQFSPGSRAVYHLDMATGLDQSRITGDFRDVYTVSRLNREVREILESSFTLLWVTGEISNLAQPSSGHWYFSLKDAAAQVRCAMFRSQNARVGFAPENGIQVLARARVGLYENRGEFQLVVEHVEPAGDGALRLEFERLKQKLTAHS